MQLPIFFILALAFILLLIAVVLVYLQIYKRHINRALQMDGTMTARMPAPYKVALGFVIGFLLVSLIISLVVKESGRITTPEQLIQDAHSVQTLAEDWNVDVSMDGSLAAILLYNEDGTDHTFKVYKDRGGNRTDYIFAHGGSSVSVECSVWGYKYAGMRALISMNEMGIARIVSHAGEEYIVDPEAPFALVLQDGGFDAFDSEGTKLDFSGEWWYEEIDGN